MLVRTFDHECDDNGRTPRVVNYEIPGAFSVLAIAVDVCLIACGALIEFEGVYKSISTQKLSIV